MDVKRPMPAGNMNTSVDAKRMRTAPAEMPAVKLASTVSASSQQHACSVLNAYNSTLVYELVREYGPQHAKIFTMELIVDDQVGKMRCSISTLFALY